MITTKKMNWRFSYTREHAAAAAATAEHVYVSNN
jgi:hypothetical protein